MDFIEKIFGVSPDGGSGTLEAALIVVPVAAVIYFVLRNRRNR